MCEADPDCPCGDDDDDCAFCEEKDRRIAELEAMVADYSARLSNWAHDENEARGPEPEVLPKPESFNGTLEQWVAQRNAILRRAMDAMGVLKEEKTP